ncbi:MAG: 4-(cytidine 5'-diphospho)-2-C-methyl-D-erythritol kinase [Deltaproteobacteria bacterium]|nr:4-(cytidine 5'-diphospho)-2-C-methyl-D-erythritol kinase [Deltaproteobacteria bacterium]
MINERSSTHFAPAKLNVRLKVTGRRPDGYHELVSIMVPVGLYDRLDLRLTSDKKIHISCRGFLTPSDEENLVCRAARAFFGKTGIDHGILIRLTKNIPVAAGLGGGSSDAACVLKVLNRNYGYPLAPEELAELALMLGADVPFFLEEAPCIARGVGEILEPILNWPALWYIIIMPPIQVSTSWVYGCLNLSPASSELKLTNEAYKDIVKYLNKRPLFIGQVLENDLERITAARFPIIERIKGVLTEAGADGALMSGSGPSVFGIFQSKDRAFQAKEALAGSNLGEMFLVKGLTGSPVSNI